MSQPTYVILDNDKINSGVLIEMLEYIGGCSYHLITSPQKLVELLQFYKPDVIFCNTTARGCDAREVCRNNDIDIPIIYISVLDKSEERRKCFLNSGHPYLTSPLTPEMIQAVI